MSYNPPYSNYSLRITKSNIAGKGAFAEIKIPAKRKIGEMGGYLISLRLARKIVKDRKNVKMVEFNNGKALNGSIKNNTLSFINHSCDPNTYMRLSYNRVEFYSLRNIKVNEELTCNYGETHHDGKLNCRCGAKNCRGFI